MKQNHDMAETFEGMELIEETLLNNINGAVMSDALLAVDKCCPL